MPATALTAVAPFQMIFSGENDIPVFIKIIHYRLIVFIRNIHACYNTKVPV